MRSFTGGEARHRDDGSPNFPGRDFPGRDAEREIECGTKIWTDLHILHTYRTHPPPSFFVRPACSPLLSRWYYQWMSCAAVNACGPRLCHNYEEQRHDEDVEEKNNGQKEWSGEEGGTRVSSKLMVKNPWEVDDESQLRSRKRNCYLACVILIIFVVIFQRGFELIKLNRRAIINCQNSLSKRSRRSQNFIFYQSCPSLPFLMKKTFASRIKYSPFQSSNIYLPFSKIKIDKKSSKKIKNLHKKSKRKNRNLDLISLDFLFNLHQKKISFHPLLF